MTGHAPPEQYGAEAGRQGPWSDIYAMAATFYHAITGAAPADAIQRLAKDNYVSLTHAAAGQLAPGFLAAVDAALSLSIDRRPRSVAAWREMLFATSPAPSATMQPSQAFLPASAPVASSPLRPGPAPAKPRRKMAVWIAVGASSALLLAAAAGVYFFVSDRNAKACSESLSRVRQEVEAVLTKLPGQRPPVWRSEPACERALAEAQAELRRLRELARDLPPERATPQLDPKPPVIEPKPPASK